MFTRISHCCALLVLLLLGAYCVTAQVKPAPECPSIEVRGPTGIIEPDAEGEFRVKLVGRVPKHVAYEWDIPNVPIVSGQQSDTVRFRMVFEALGISITATVRVVGLPRHCTSTGSETFGMTIHHGPVHVSTITNVDTQSKMFGELFDELEKNPNSQGYIFIGADPKTDRPKQIEDLIRYKALGSGIDQSRLTIKKESTAKEIVELWRVPPGANNPLCRACESPADVRCPAVSVRGPSGIPKPGEPIQYVANITGDIPKGVTYRWSASTGTIIEGQGTTKIMVGPDWADSQLSLTVTIEILALPSGCPTTSSETMAI